MIKFAVLITCYNRRDTTINSLNYLFKNEKASNWLLDVFLVDDGCTDGTSEAVKKLFPNVKIIKGSGNLFWNQGMRLAWINALNEKKYNFFIWLNDDTILEQDALIHLFTCYKESFDKTKIASIVVGACKESNESQILSYGGRTDREIVKPNGSLQSCKYINGNIVLIPNIIQEKIGILSNDYTHGMGDYDYGLRALRNGFTCITTKIYVATCPTNKILPTWCNPEKSINERIRAFNSPLGLNIKEYILFRKKFWKRRWFSFVIKAYLKMIFPRLYTKIF